MGVCHDDRFDMRSHERAFVKPLHGQGRNLWLYRANERGSCGDFIVADRSCSRRARRCAPVVELEGFVIGGARLQCANHREPVAELVARDVLAAESPVELLYGGETAVLAHLGAS